MSSTKTFPPTEKPRATPGNSPNKRCWYKYHLLPGIPTRIFFGNLGKTKKDTSGCKVVWILTGIPRSRRRSSPGRRACVGDNETSGYRERSEVSAFCETRSFLNQATSKVDCEKNMPGNFRNFESYCFCIRGTVSEFPYQGSLPQNQAQSKRRKTASGFDTVHTGVTTIPHDGVRTLSRTGPV